MIRRTKSIVFGMLFLMIISQAVFASLSPAHYQKLDPNLALLLDHPELSPLVYRQMIRQRFDKADPKIHVLIKTTLDRSSLSKLGAMVDSRIGDIVSAWLTIDRLQALLESPAVKYISGPKPGKVHNNVSVAEIKATIARQQYNLTGKGVLIGIIDTGIDWRHADFRNPDGTTRIKAILDLHTPGNDKAGGTIYTEQGINNALNGIGTVSEQDVVGHGTHVAGSAAGNGSATGNGVAAGTYMGVAPEADLVIVKITRSNGLNLDVVDLVPSLYFIDSVATSLNQNYVVNISLGGNLGPHDGTDLTEQAIDELLTTPGSKCKAVVVSAGNDGDADIHASGTLSGSTNKITTKFTVSSYTPNSDNLDDFITFEGWYKGIYNYSIQVITPSGGRYGPISSGHESAFDTNDGVVYITNAKGGTSQLNDDKQFFVRIYDYYASKPPKQGDWQIVVFGSAGRFDLWLSGASMDVSITSNIDPSMIVGTPGTAFHAITVGAYVTKRTWTDLDGNHLQFQGLVVGSAASFSSPGPTRDGRLKPEISAPGQMIASSYSIDAPPTGQYSIFKSSSSSWPNAYIVRDGKHALSQGTSFAAPHVAGAIALMVEQNPDITPEEIRQAITLTARTDSYTGSVPNNKWGNGKINALTALELLAVEEPAAKATLPKEMELHQNFPNPFNPTTVIPYSIAQTTTVRITVFNMLGQQVRTLVDDVMNPGAYKVAWDGKDDLGKTVSSGIYFYRLDAGRFSLVRKMILLP